MLSTRRCAEGHFNSTGVSACTGQPCSGLTGDKVAPSLARVKMGPVLRADVNGRAAQRVFLQRESYSTANICGGSGQRQQKQGAQGKGGQRHRRKKG